MGAVAGGGLDLGLGWGRREGVGVMEEEVAEVEGVGDGFLDGYGARMEDEKGDVSGIWEWFFFILTGDFVWWF